MKKRIWIMVLVLALCLAFTGCTLDSMRKSHAICNEEGKIEWNGQVYMLLPDNVMLSPKLDYSTQVYVTESDVPVLLRRLYGYSTGVSEDGKFLVGWYGGTHCRSDCYEEVAEMVKNPNALEYFCYYSAYSGERLRISKEDSQWLRSVLEQLEPMESDDSEGDWNAPTQMEYAYCEYVAELDACSEDMLLQQFAYNIMITEEGYLFERYDEETGDYVQLQFPQEEMERLKSILNSNIPAPND